MPSGARLRFVLLSSVQGRRWHAPAFGLIFIAIFLWLNNRLSLWAQPPAPPLLLISEVHADANAVGDEVGEWIEVANPSAEAVNLQGWRLLKSDNEYAIATELWIAPGDYLLLAVNGNPAQNGGIQPDYVYIGFTLANQNDHLTLRSPDDQVVDSVAWGEGTGLIVFTGASLERTTLDANAPWVVAHSPWPGSAGDLGSPGLPYVPPPTDTSVPTATEIPTATPTPSATLSPTATPSPTPLPDVPPRLFLSEVMADPAAVSDDLGEWIELYNGDATAVNLDGWLLADGGSDHVVLSGELWLQPGAYIILARRRDPAQNGGVAAQIEYAGLQLANEEDELFLIAPWGVQVDQLFWQPATLQIPSGASLERTGFDSASTWAAAHAPWNGSVGDWGSPGAPYTSPTATATSTSLPSLTPTPPATATPLPTSSPTPPPAVPPHLLLSEVMANPAAVSDEMGEWVELYNGDIYAINLDGWLLADEGGEQTLLQGEQWLAPGEYLVLARNGDPTQNGGVVAQKVYAGLQLANEEDELLLITPWGARADTLFWGKNTLTITSGASLERASFDSTTAWATAYAPWFGSAGDRGSPGAPYTLPPTPTFTPSVTTLPTPTLTTTATASPSPTSSQTPPPAIPPRLLLSEMMADPAAVSDDLGEWIELYNGDSIPINLDGWILADQGDDRVVLDGELWLLPGSYAILARSTDAAQNGNVTAHMGYTGLQLANQEDELLLITPWGLVVDQLFWSAGSFEIPSGASVERTGFDGASAWAAAYAPWPGSAGDLGSPGVAYTPPPTSTPLASATGAPTPTPSTATPSPTLPSSTMPPPSATFSPTPSPTPPPANAPRLFLSEVMADPAAVSDDLGEWIELYNGDTVPVNLHGWILADQDNDQTLINGELWLAPNSYVVLAREVDSKQNGGVTAQMAYSGLQLANEEDELLLFTPWGALVDTLLWSKETLKITSGASLERSGFDPTATWVAAHALWPGSAGDLGSPGTPYTSPPTPIPLPTVTPSPTATAALIPSPTPSSTPISTPLSTSLPTPPPIDTPRLYLSEVMADPAMVSDEAGEWIELYNGDSKPINVEGWRLADADNDEAILSGELWLEPGGYLVLARLADPTQNGNVPAQMEYTGLQLANGADELLLITPWGALADQLLWSAGTLKITPGASLERSDFDDGGVWVTAHSPWPGSAGDLGSPGAPFSPSPTPVLLPTVTPSPTATLAPLSTSSSTPVLTPTRTPSPTPSATLPPLTPPRLFLSEVMANPAAVRDENGEWIELYNGDTVPVNLDGWILADQGNEEATLSGELWLPPGGYIVLARMDDRMQNGGVAAHMGYSGLQLANGEDELLLLTPWGVVVDQLFWGMGTRKIANGASLERTGFDATSTWITADAPWPGSAGDLGSPGVAYTAPIPTPPVTLTGSPVATFSPTPTATATATPSATALPAAWGRRSTPSPLVIAQVFPQGSDQEYAVLRNVSDAPIALAGWRLGDAEIPGDREGVMLLPEGIILAPGASWVAARKASAFHTLWGRAADAEWGASDVSLPQLVPDAILASGELALADNGDELLLLDPSGAVADVVAWEDGSYALLGLAGHLEVPSQSALYQAPGAPYPIVNDLRHRFMLLPPNPFSTFTLPAQPAHHPVPLAGGMLAQWGSLGASSTFSPDGITPPHILLAAAGALGLDFIAIADFDRAPTDMVISAQSNHPIVLPAWRWQDPEGKQAIIYSDFTTTPVGWGDLLQFLREANVLAQLPPQVGFADQQTPLLAADDVSAPGGLADLQEMWQSLEMPLLPAGNTVPPLPGMTALTPHYTGLAATASDPGALLEALRQRRGWLTSAPGLWLTLQSDSGEWMGSMIAPANQLTLHLAYGDASGESAGLALWQGDHLVRQLDIPPADGRWSVTLPAAPGSMTYAVATQLDGDFAITAPLFVAPAEGGEVRINEVLPAPGADHNGDGVVNSNDEYIELINTGSAPLSLAKYSLGDSATPAGGRRFTFGVDRFIGAGERLLLWRADTGLNLNDDADFIELFDADGKQLDHIGWEKRGYGPSLSRLPDGGDWQMHTPPTPGQANQAAPPPAPRAPSKPDSPPVDRTDVRDPESPTFGQASGPPGSVALAKLRGLETITEFRGQVIVPPGLFPSAIYVAEAALDANGAPLPIAGLGIQVYLHQGEFIPMQEGDWLLVRGGVVKSFRGEMEIQIEEAGQAWPYEPGTPLTPLPIAISAITETLEGRLVTFTGVVTGWQGDSIYLGDPTDPDVLPVRVTVRASLGWKRPYVKKGEMFQVVGVVGQFGTAAPWNDGYRVLVRYEGDLAKLPSP